MDRNFKKFLQVIATLGSVAGLLLWLSKQK